MTDEREEVAKELRREREAAELEGVPVREPEAVLGAPKPLEVSPAQPLEVPSPPEAAAPAVPDLAAVNESWNVRESLQRGDRLARLVGRVARRLLDTQVRFNARQVQLDNQLIEFLVARFEAVHRQYDAVLGVHGRHMQDIDERHLILQEELVAHVHDLVRRIDLTLSEAERTRVSLEAELRELRARVAALEARQAKG